MSEKADKNWTRVKDIEADGEDFLEDENEAEEEDLQSALEHPSYLALEEKLTLAEQKAHENWEKSVRALAELDNVRRRAERDIANAHRYGLEKLINALLPVADSLEQALQLAVQHSDESMQEGLRLTIQLFLGVLEKHEVQQLNPEGAPFNPEQHEAMTIQASETVPPNTVLSVFQKGYQLKDRIIRPARVIVSK